MPLAQYFLFYFLGCMNDSSMFVFCVISSVPWHLVSRKKYPSRVLLRYTSRDCAAYEFSTAETKRAILLMGRSIMLSPVASVAHIKSSTADIQLVRLDLTQLVRLDVTLAIFGGQLARFLLFCARLLRYGSEFTWKRKMIL